MATYRLFSYRSLNLTPEELVEDFYFPWESVSQEPIILTEDKTVKIEEITQIDGEDVVNEIEHIVEAGNIDPAWYEFQECEHSIQLATVRGDDDTEISMELEFFDDIDEDGNPFVNTKEVEKVVTTDPYWRTYVLCCEHCESYQLPVRMDAKWEDVATMSDQELRNIYELSGRIDIEKARAGDAEQLNSLGLRNIDWNNTVSYISPDVTTGDRKPRAPGPAGGTNANNLGTEGE